MKLKTLLDSHNLLDDTGCRELLNGEEFRDLITPLYPEIKPKYQISNMNRVFNVESHRFISVMIKKNGNGYWHVNLQCQYEGFPYTVSKDFGMHRLMMAIFKPVEGMEYLVVNHIDGNKTNNSLDNLEWVTTRRNAQHAVETGLFIPQVGELASGATITEETARKICEMFETGRYSNQEIADKFGVSKSLVGNIGTGNSWRSVSKDFDFNKREFYKKSTKYTPEDIHKMCLFFEMFPKKERESTRHYLIRTATESGLMDLENIDENLLYSMRWIYKRKSYTKISSQYKF